MQLAVEREKEIAHASSAEASRASLSAKDEHAAVFVGNSHQQLTDGNHRWKLYVQGEAAELLSSVEVWLHPTFKQNHFKIDTMPFELPCTGWGTFDTRLRLHKKSGGHVDVTWPLQFDQDNANKRVEL